MDSTKVREYLRRHVLGLLAIFIALSGTAVAAQSGPTASSSAVSNKKFKKLKKKVNGLNAQLNSPATGDLQGTYPNLTIRDNAVTETKIADNAVTTGKIADAAVSTGKLADLSVTEGKLADLSVTEGKIAAAAVSTGKLANGSVGANALKSIITRSGVAAGVAAAGSTLTSKGCNAGEQVVSGGGTWDSSDADLAMSQAFLFGNWFVRAGNSDGAAHNFTPIAECLEP